MRTPCNFGPGAVERFNKKNNIVYKNNKQNNTKKMWKFTSSPMTAISFPFAEAMAIFRVFTSLIVSTGHLAKQPLAKIRFT